MIGTTYLSALFPSLSAPRSNSYLPPLLAAMQEFEINTPRRVAAFLSQLAVESGEFKWFQEIWGPTPEQLRYEPPHRKAQELGNTQQGDGFRYRGRGPIQLTGRANYRTYGRLLGLPLEQSPELAATPAVGFRIAGLYWKQKGLNALADQGNVREITRRINGAYRHLDRRVSYYQRALSLFGGVNPSQPLSVAKDSSAVIIVAVAILLLLLKS